MVAALEGAPLDEAKAYFEATLYEGAIDKCNAVLKMSSLTKREQEEAQDLLAQAYLYSQNPQKALEVLNDPPPPPEGNYLKGVAFKALGDLTQAEAAFTEAAKSPNPRQQETLLELGTLRFALKKDPEETRQPFDEIKLIPGKETLYNQAQIYLARLDLGSENCDRAIKRLRALQMSLPSGSSYNIQAAFWTGMAHYQKGNLHEAIQAFAASLPKKGGLKTPWQSETLHYMVDCTLQLAQMQGNMAFFNQAEELLNGSEPSEEGDLALAELLLFKGQLLKDQAIFQKGRTLIETPGKFTTLPLRGKVCSILAQVTEGEEREKYLAELTSPTFKGTMHYEQGWLWRGFDYLKRALSLKKREPAFASIAFQNAANAFEESGPAAKRYQAEALWHLKTPAALDKAYKLLESEKPSGETFFLKGLIASETDRQKGIDLLKEGLAHADGESAEKIQFLLGTLYFHDQRFKEALTSFLELSETTYDEGTASQALLWAARCSEEQPDEARSLRKKIFETYPNTSAAGEAYFFFYPYREYVQGERGALKHLQSFLEKFPKSPLGINARYLIGMDFKRDRKTVEGKWIRKKDLNRCIEAFQDGETLFEELARDNKVPEEDYPFYLKVKTRSTLERALANLAIADESQGAKRQIFLEYAEDVFREIEAEAGNVPEKEEGAYWLTQTLLRQGQKEEAKRELEKMIERYKAAHITRGYFLSRVWYELGQLALENNQPQAALEYFSFAEDAAKGKILSTDQRIDLLIQKSLSYLALNETDTAMLLLSQAINSDEVSGLRIKAMYLRAEIYQQQGRKELARKQLEATSQKGGPWAQKAKQKLDEEL